MALQVWLPLIGDVHNQGLSNLEFSLLSTNTTIDSNGKIGSCYTNNSNGAGGLVSNTVIELGQKQSMFCWFKFTSLESSSSLGGGLVSQHRYGSNQGMGITIRYVSSTTGYLSVNTGNGSSRTYNTYYGTTLLQANTWYHGGYTYDGQNIRIYVNGVLEKTQAYSGMKVPADYLTVFCWSMGSGNAVYNDYHLNGAINDVRVYDHCLSSKEVKEISKGLAVHYKLNEQYVGEYTNVLPNGNYGTTNGSTWTAHYYTSVVEDAIGPVPFEKNNKVEIQYITSATTGGGCGLARASNMPTSPNTTYIYSMYVKPSDNMVYRHNNFLYRYEYNASGEKTTEGGIFTSAAGKEYVGDGWYRIWNTFTTTSATTKFHVYFYTYPNKNITYYIGGTMVETGTTLHPYTEGTSSNNIMYDSSGYLRNGQHYSGTVIPVKNEGAARNEYSIENTSGYIGKAEVNMPPLDKITFSWWANYKVFGAQTSGLFSTSNNATDPTDYSTTACNMRDSYFDMCNTAGSCKRLSATGIELNKWHHYCITYDGATERFYVDGVEKSTIAQTGALKDFKYLYISYSRAGGVVRMCRGPVSDFRIYCTALSAADVKEMYETAASVDNKGNFHCYELKEV